MEVRISPLCLLLRSEPKLTSRTSLFRNPTIACLRSEALPNIFNLPKLRKDLSQSKIYDRAKIVKRLPRNNCKLVVYSLLFFPFLRGFQPHYGEEKVQIYK